MRSGSSSDLAADPFHEHRRPLPRERFQLLGAHFEFECGSAQLREIIRCAYTGLPRHLLGKKSPRLRVSVLPGPDALGHARHRRRGTKVAPAPANLRMLSGTGLLCGTSSASDFAVMDCDAGRALVVVSQAMVAFPYNTRYELIEFAAFTLAMRSQGLIPLHGACVGAHGRSVVLMGETGAGKSTVALHAALRGMEFLSEDSMFVTPDAQRLTGVANFLHIRCDSLQSCPPRWRAMIRRAPIIERRSGVRKFEIDLRQRGFRLAQQPPRLAAVVFMSKRSAGRSPLLTALTPSAGLDRFAAEQPYALRQPGWSAFRRKLAQVPSFELRRGSNPEQSVDALEGLLHGALQGE